MLKIVTINFSLPLSFIMMYLIVFLFIFIKSTNDLTANNAPFRFGYDSESGKYGYILNEGGADTVIPFSEGTIAPPNIDPEKSKTFLLLYVQDQSNVHNCADASCLLSGYKRIAFIAVGYSPTASYRFRDSSGTDISNGTITTSWSNYIDIPSNAAWVYINANAARSGYCYIYASILNN